VGRRRSTYRRCGTFEKDEGSVSLLRLVRRCLYHIMIVCTYMALNDGLAVGNCRPGEGVGYVEINDNTKYLAGFNVVLGELCVVS
jgi:hypothetical protein